MKNDDSPTRTSAMQLLSFIKLVYPRFSIAIQRLRYLPLSTRSILVKACQSQKWPISPDATISRLLHDEPDVAVYEHYHYFAIKPTEILQHLPDSFDITSPTDAGILLDILRSLPLNSREIDEACNKSWNTEIGLAESTSRPQTINWSLFFSAADPNTPIADDIKANPNMMRTIRRMLIGFRKYYHGRILWPRATHKNMSRATRRDYENRFHDDLSDVPIFGQDDWERTYERTGVELGGCCEMRQRWPPGVMKPRTYFAMGGEAYRDCRFLQDFFSDLVNLFSPTHHISRLRPERLVVDPKDGTVRYYIYDLSSFTSNMSEQKYFMDELGNFFAGVEVTVMDERRGPIAKDLGEMLEVYAKTCVRGPLLSLERFNGDETSVPHGMASLLGIFGNLMTCTTGHFFAISPLMDNFLSGNVAGDDGIIGEDAMNSLDTHLALCHIGAYSRDKCFAGDEDAPVCLKRPFTQNIPICAIENAYIPPSLAKSHSYLVPWDVDPRFQFYDRELLSPSERVGVVGKDLLRYMSSGFDAGMDMTGMHEVWNGYTRAVRSTTGIVIDLQGCDRPFWPASPIVLQYGIHPALHMLLYTRITEGPVFKHGEIGTDEQAIRYQGEEEELNSSKRLKLLERLGYVTLENIVLEAVDNEFRYEYWRKKLLKRPMGPDVYRVSVVKDIPDHWFYQLQ